MAFTNKQFDDLRGILFLMLLAIPSIATTNIDCNGKPFQCVNSTHFMICVDLGSGVSSTIDSFIIPCPAPTECHNTNRFECEFPAANTVPPIKKPLGITTEQTTLSPTQAPLEIIPDQTTIVTVQVNESAVQPYVPEIITTIPFEDLYNTVRTTTLSESELTTTNPILVTDSPTIDVIGNTNVTTNSELEVGGRNTDVLNIKSSTQNVLNYSETTVSPVVPESVVANTTENAFVFTPTDSKINTINEISKVSPVVENVNFITENKTEPDIKSISDKQIVNGNLNITDSIQNPAINTIESFKNNPHNNTVSISETTVDQSTIANDQDQVKNTPTNSKINTINEISTVNRDVKIAITENFPIYTTTENVNFITENKNEPDIKSISDKQIVNGNLNITDSIQNPAINTIDSVQNNPQNNTVSISETTVDQSTIANDQDQVKNTPTNSKINTINEISTVNRDVKIAITENFPIYTTTENVNFITENKTEPDLKSTSDKQKVNGNLNITDSIQNPATKTIESVKNNPHNNTVSISEITVDQSTIANDQDQVKNTPTNSKINTINEISTVSPDVEIAITEHSPIFTTTENVHLIAENKTGPDIKSIFDNKIVTSTINIMDSIQNPAIYTIESVKNNPHNYTDSISEITVDQSSIANDQDQIKKDKAKETTVTVTNAFENVLINDKNTTTTLTDINEHLINDAFTEQAQPNYRTPETIVTSSGIPNDFNIATKSIIPTREPNVIGENKIIVGQDKPPSSVVTPTKEKVMSPILITNITMSTENVTANNNFNNVATGVVVTGPSSELHDAVNSSTVPTIDTTLNTETTTLHDVYVTYYRDSGNVIVDNIPTTDLLTSDFPSSHTDKNIGITESINFETTQNDIVVQSLGPNLKTSSDNLLNLATTDTPHKKALDFNNDKIINELRKINPAVHKILTTRQNEPTKTTLQERVDINTSQKTASIAIDSKLVGTEPITIVNEHKSINTTAVNSTSSEKQVTLGTAQNFLPSITTVSESNIDFTSNVNSQTFNLDPSSNTNTSTINSQHKLPSNMDLNAGKQDMNIVMTTTEPTLTENNTDNSIVNKIIQSLEHTSILPQSDIATPTMKTKQISDSLNYDIVSDGNIRFEPSITSSPIVPTETFLYVKTHTPEITTRSDDVIKSAVATNNELNSQNEQQINLFGYSESILHPIDATAQYSTESNKKAGQANDITTSGMYYITDLPHGKASEFYADKIISGLHDIESTGHKITTATQDDQTKTPLQGKIDMNTSQNTATIAADSKLVNIESIFVGYEQSNIQTIAAVLTAVTESNLFLKSVGDQLPNAIDISNKNKLNVSETSTEKSKKVEPKGHDLTIAPIIDTLVPSLIETQTQLSEFKTLPQKKSNTISGVTHSIAEYDTISKLPVIETTRHSFDVVSQTVSPDSVSQLTSSSVNTKKTNIPSTILNYISSPANNIIKNNPDFIDDRDEIKKYSTGDLSTGSMSTVTVSGNLDSRIQDNAIGSLQYNPNNKGLPQGHQTPIEQIKTEFKFPIQNNIEKISQTPQDEALLNQDIAANIGNNLVPTNLPFKSENVNKPNIQETGVGIVENAVISVIQTTTTVELQKIVPAESHVVTSNTAFGKFNQKVQTESLLESTNNNKNDTFKGTTFKGSPLFELLNTGNISKQNIDIDKQIFINQEGPRTTESISKEFNNVAVNEGKAIDADIANNTSTSYSVTTSKIIPMKSSTGRDFITTVNSSYLVKNNKDNTSALTLIGINIEKNITVRNKLHLTEAENVILNEGIGTSADAGNKVPISSIMPVKFVPERNLATKDFDKFKNQTSTINSSHLITLSALSLIGKSVERKNTVKNNKNISEKENLQTPIILESHSIVRLNTTAPTQTLNIVPIANNKISSPVAIIFDSKKNQTRNSETNLTATPILQSLHIIGDDKTVNIVSATEKNNGTGNTHPNIVASKDGYQKNGIKAAETRSTNLAERDVSTTSNKLSTSKVESTSSSQNANKNAFEVVNLAPFDLLSSVHSGGFEEKSNKPSTEKPEDEETNESENGNINKNNILTTLSFESLPVTTESVEGDNNAYSNNIVQSINIYETLTSKPTIQISTRPTQVDNIKNIQPQPIIPEVSTQSTVRSTSLKLSLENNTPLPATTNAVTNDFVCKFNQRGRFADNHDCRKFYICLGRLQPLEGICPIQTVFSELRKQCTKNLSHCVRNNQFQCVSEGRFSDFLNDNIYYICVKNKLNHFTRFKLRCQNGYHLNKTSVRCALNTESSQSISSDISKSNSEQSAALKVEVKRKDSSKNKFECKEEGTFADPNNCRVYYVCKKTSKPEMRRKKKKCDSDESFHKDKKKCVDAESYECK